MITGTSENQECVYKIITGRHSADLFSIIVFIEGRTEKIDDIL